MSILTWYLKGACATPFTKAFKEGFALHAVTQVVAFALFPAAPRRARMVGAYAAATVAGVAILALRGAREERPLEVLIAESNKRTAKGLVAALHTAQGWAESVEDAAEALGVALGDARRSVAAAGGVSTYPVAPPQPVNTRRPAPDAQEN
jgi:hypothetical protein